VDRDAFRAHFRAYVLIRIFQALGAYGYRGFYERKRHFLLSVAPAVENLERLVADGFLPVDVPELRATCERICATPSLRERAPPSSHGLTLHVGSFSYRRGYPEDGGEHGGGYVFDCRALPNPGRDPVLAGLSGFDEAVVRHLADSAEVAAFCAHVEGLVDAQLEVYRARGFSSLGVWFGCTGGQHRSVYLAERLARHVRERLPEVRVLVTHTESQRWPASAARPGSADDPAATGGD
jgi:RNase adaptor protein for sRNA GlmZ degradation